MPFVVITDDVDYREREREMHALPISKNIAIITSSITKCKLTQTYDI